MLAKSGWASCGDIEIAYQVLGEGPPDLLVVPSYVSHLEQIWEEPSYARFLRSLSSFSRLIILDKRGTGLSSRISGLPALEDRMDDIRAVMDAVESPCAALLGGSEGGMIGVLFAASFPERVSALVLYGMTARFLADTDYPWGMSPAEFEKTLDSVVAKWGTGETSVPVFAPNHAGDRGLVAWAAKFERLAATPGEFRNYLRSLARLDIRDVLPKVHVPTLVLHRSGDRAVDVGHARYIAKSINSAKYVELEGDDHWWFLGDSERILREIQSFVTGEVSAQGANRRFATLLITDIVQSTNALVASGDVRWADWLQRLDRLIQGAINSWQGRFEKDTGDGWIATFDGPTRAIKCAIEITDEAIRLGLHVRAGLHAGEIDRRQDEIRGVAIHIAARVGALAEPDEILVTRTVKDLVAGSDLVFAERGRKHLKGIPEEWDLGDLYTVVVQRHQRAI